ncbi:recombinase family protein [Saccharibacillus sp. CPCC 101409]|uniref:recombinase family protein n=1 Tax=Saccharibacillus sp. CPCC 101409 TaxID=3058041 RepID=UPI0026738A3B|nr:recombinase family protein [Saccharibacillus sp. CPCC 101409]MDO3411492.1 recombinase family protein [Saccharibacillus sp. CPCC 101409]
MKVAIYVRVSSDRQAEKELSIPAQQKAIHQYCQDKGWIVVSEFIEKGKSAKTDDRPEFQKMIAIAKRSNCPFEAVVVHKFDRFSRKRDDHVLYKALLAQHGVKVISITEQTEAATPQDMLLEGMLEVISEFFNANLATEVRKGMTQNAKQGYNNGGTPPYGYRTEHIALGHQKTKTVWVPGAREEIDTVRWIFNQYAFEGKGYHRIASELNERKVPTQKGGTWSTSTIRAIIFNETYIGRKVWNKQDYQTKGKKWRDRSEWIITENAHPAIITKELFDQCQTVAKQRHNGGGETHRASGKPASPFWLRGMMVCDKCGTRMVGNSTSSRTKSGGQKYYVCGGYLRKGKEFCPYIGWRKERIEEIVTNKLRTTLMRLLMDNQLEEEIRLYYADQHRHSIQQAVSLEAEIGFLQKRIQTVEADMRSGKAKPYHQEILDEMQAELSEKTTEYDAVKETVGDVVIPEEYIASVKYDMQTLIGLLDAEVPNPQMLTVGEEVCGGGEGRKGDETSLHYNKL